MAQFSIKTDKILQSNDAMNKILADLKNDSLQVDKIRQSIGYNNAAMVNVSKRLQNLTQNVNKNASMVKTMSNSLADIAQHYKTAESNILNHNAGNENINTDHRDEGTKAETKRKSILKWSDAWKITGEIGMLGPVVSVIGTAFTENDPIKKGLNIAKYLAKETGKIASASKFDWKNVLGWTGGGQKLGLGESFAKELGKLKFSNAKTVGENIAVGAKWAGNILTVATTAYDNFTDPGNATLGRKIAETVGESAVKIAEGVILGAVVGTVGAPAVVTGAIVVGVTWAIDAGCKAICGKDLAEVISDTVIDTACYVGKAAKEAGKAVSGWWNNMWKQPKLAGAW